VSVKQTSDLRTLLSMTALLVIPAALTLHSVRVPGTLQIPSDDPSPYGYTWSLLLFIAPVIALERWLAAHPAGKLHHRAFWLAIVAFFCAGAILDFGFAYLFFEFPNRGAVLGLYLPAFDLATCTWKCAYLPVEEFGFYYFGALFTIGLYAFGDLGWAAGASERKLPAGRLVRLNWTPLVIGALLVGAAWLYKLVLAPGTGVPGYFSFLVLLGVVPTSLLIEVVGPGINVRALGFMYTALLLISLLWEATLAVPYGWWNYHHDQMLGLYIGPWAQLPIEAVLMWVLAGWAAVVLYEAALLWLGRRAGDRA
jgi:hypothetical protein